MNRTNLLVMAGAILLGYVAAKNLVGYQPFTWAYTQGATVAVKAS